MIILKLIILMQEQKFTICPKHGEFWQLPFSPFKW